MVIDAILLKSKVNRYNIHEQSPSCENVYLLLAAQHSLQAAIPLKKRTDYLSWEDYFMAVAFLSAQRSKDPNSQV